MVPVIEGEKSGIIVNSENAGQLNFYDGVVIGRKTIEGRATDTEDLTEEEKYIVITEKEETEKQKSYLSTPLAYPVRIDNIHYSSLTKAVSVCKEGETITLLRGIELQDTEEIPEDKNVIIDLNGFTLTSQSTECVIKNNGNLKIVDNKEGTKGKITSSMSKTIIYNSQNANLEIKDIEIEKLRQGDLFFRYDIEKYEYLVDNYGTLTVTDGVNIHLRYLYNIAIKNNENGILNIKGGVIECRYGSSRGETDTVGIYNNGELNAEGGEINAIGAYGIYNNEGNVNIKYITINTSKNRYTVQYGIFNNKEGIVTIEDALINSEDGDQGIYNNGTGSINVKNGTFNCKITNISSGEINIYNGKMSARDSVICNTSNGIINIFDGTINSIYGCAIENNNNGVVNINNGKLNSDQYAVCKNSEGEINIKGGELTANNRNYGALYNNSTGIITIGEKDGIVNLESPIIKNNYINASAIINAHNLGEIKFYDGTIISKGDLLNGNMSDIEEGMSLNKEILEDNTTKVTLCEIKEDVAQIGNERYKTLKVAIQSCEKTSNSEATEIILLKNIDYLTKVEIENNQNIKINLNGHTIETYEDMSIINNGTLELCDETAEGNIIVNSTNTIKNNGDMTISKVKITYDISNKLSLLADSYVIINGDEAVLKILEGANLINETGGRRTGKLIYNEGNGTVDIYGGNISADGDAIINERQGIVNIRNGRIVGNIANKGEGTVNIIDGTIIKTTVSNWNEGTVNIKNGNIEGTISISKGTCNINGGTIKGKISNWNTSTLIIRGGDIIGTGDAIVKNYGNLEMLGGHISGIGNYGINNSGNITIIGGTIQSEESDGIYQAIYHEKGTITVGEKDGNVNDKSPCIVGGENGIFFKNATESTFNFYDGLIKGKKAINLSPNDIEDGYEMIIEKKEEIENAYLSTGIPMVRMNEIEYKKLSELQSAINELEDSEETVSINILRDITIQEEGENIIIPENKKIELNFNGFSILSDKVNVIVNNGDLSIKDNSETPGNIISSVSDTICNNGNLSINNIEVKSTGTTVINTGSLEVKGGQINGPDKAIENRAEGEIKISEGRILSLRNAIYSDSIGKLTVLGGYIRGDEYCIYNNNRGEIIVQDGELHASSYGIYNRESGKVNIKGGAFLVSSFNISYGIYNESIGEIIVEGGSISSHTTDDRCQAYGIYNKDNANITISGTGEVCASASNSISRVYSIYNEKGVVNILGGKIKASQNGRGEGIHNSADGIIIMTGGAIEANKTGIYNIGQTTITGGNILGKEYGIHNYTSGILTIGTKDGNINSESPQIKAQYSEESRMGIGVFNDSGFSEFNFYDGNIKGGKKATNILPTDIEESQLIIEEDTSTNTEKAYLVNNIPMASINEINYNNLDEIQEAINNIEASEEKVVIQIKRNVAILDNENGITIPNGKKIEINLNGYKIISSINETIINNGELTVTNSTLAKGAICSEGDTFILNNNIMCINNIAIDDPNLESKIIKNNGTLNIENTDLLGGKIYNCEGGTLNINGGTINIANVKNASDKKNTGIDNIEAGTININEGIIDISIDEGILNANSGILNINGGTIQSSNAGMYIGIANNNQGILNMTGGTVKLQVKNNNSEIIFNGGNINNTITNTMGEIEISGGTMQCIERVAIVNNSGAIVIKEGVISGGISNVGTITIGEKGKGVSKTTPIIKGDTYGITNGGTLNFYDGIIKGKTAYISGTVTEVEPYYEVSLTTDEEGYQCATLTHTSQEDMCAVVNGTYYNTIQAAIDAVIGSEPITLVNGANITEAINIPEGKNITIDLAGFTINSTTENHAIINNGTLRIMDSSEGKTGAIVNQNGPAIQNNGQLTIDEGVTVTPQ